MLLFCPICPDSLLNPVDYRVIRHLVLMSLPGVWSLQYHLHSGSQSSLQIRSSLCSLARGGMDTYLPKPPESGSDCLGSKAVKPEEISLPFCFSAGGTLTRKVKKKKRKEKLYRQLTLDIMFRRVYKPVLQAFDHRMGAEHFLCAWRPQQM